MACSASTILSDAAANGFMSLDDRMVLLAIIGALLPGAGNPTASTVMAQAAAQQLGDVDDRTLDLALAGFLCSQI